MHKSACEHIQMFYCHTAAVFPLPMRLYKLCKMAVYLGSSRSVKWRGLDDEVPPLRIQTWIVCGPLCVCFITLSKLQREKSSYQLWLQRRLFWRSHTLALPFPNSLSLSLSLAVNSSSLHHYFFSPKISFHMSESNKLFASNMHTIFLPTFLHITQSHLWFATFYLSFLLLHPAEEAGSERVGRSKLRQIGKATCPVGQVCLHLFTTDLLQEAWVWVCFKKKESLQCLLYFSKYCSSLLEDHFSLVMVRYHPLWSTWSLSDRLL